MITCTRRIGFDAGHRVTRHESKCRHPHGHRYEAEITVEADDLDHVGRVMDFGVIKEMIGSWVDRVLDHGYIAAAWDHVGHEHIAHGFKVFTMPTDQEPTAENIARVIGDEGQAILDRAGIIGVRISRVRLYETPSSWADYTPQRAVA